MTNKFNLGHGGHRNNSGRKKMAESEKKVHKQVYIPKSLDLKIKNSKIPEYNSFSGKCSFFLSQGLKKVAHDNNNCVTFVDLFAGIGGTRIGFEQALKDNNLKGKMVFYSEIKSSAIKEYNKNFHEHHKAVDITKVNINNIPDFDYLLGGFPCQSFSSAGKRLGFKDTRGTLFFNLAKIIKIKRPKGFLLENVKGLLNHDHGKTFKTIYHVLTSFGYKVSYRLLDSSHFGVAQKRERVYIVGTRQHTPVNLTNLKGRNICTLRDITDKSVPPKKDAFSKKLLKHFPINYLYGKSIKDKRGGSNNIHSWDFGLKGQVSIKEQVLLNRLLKERRKKKWASIIGIQWMDGMPLTESMIRTFFDDKHLHSMLKDLIKKGYLKYEYPKKRINHRRVYDESLSKGYNIVTGKLSFEYSKILDPNGITPTLVATDVSRLAVPINGGLRTLTPREGLRLFGFPENYSLNDITKSKAFDLLGNTVCVPVIRAVANRLLKHEYND